MWAGAHAKRQEDSMNGIKFKSAVKAAFVAAAMFAAPAAIACASAPSAETAATKVGGSMERALRFRSRVAATTRIVTTRLGLPLLAAAAILGAVGVGPALADTTPVIYGSNWLHGTG